jgi:glutamate/tyrosine decarboxylase-like PLP-dependent enzyme
MDKLREQMFREFKDRSVFDIAQEYAYQYLGAILERNVYPSSDAIQDLRHFDEPIPDRTSNAIDVLNQLNKYGSPATVAQLGGRYFGFVNGSSLPVSLAAKNLGTYWDQNTAMYALSPLCSKLESVVERWLKELFGLPERAVAGFVSGTSAATFCGLAAARYRILHNQGWDVGVKGLINAPKLRIVAGRHAHSTVIKALNLLGLGTGNIEWVDVDEQGRMLADRMPDLDNRCIVAVQAANVNGGNFDPFEKICEKARRAGAWVHVDGAIGLWAAAVEKFRYLAAGLEKANSWSVDGHKTLNTPYDSGVILCEDKEALTSALHMSGSYIVLNETERDGMFFTPDMSRRSRIIELWSALRYLGKQGIDDLVTGLHDRAVQFAEEIKKEAGFRVVNDVVFNQVLVQCETDDLTTGVMKHVQDQRVCWVGGASWHGKKVIRVSVSAWTTTESDISSSVSSFARAYADVASAKVTQKAQR